MAHEQQARRTEPTVRLTAGGAYTPSVNTDIRRIFLKTDPNWPFGQLDPKVIASRRREARRARHQQLSEIEEALL